MHPSQDQNHTGQDATDAEILFRERDYPLYDQAEKAGIVWKAEAFFQLRVEDEKPSLFSEVYPTVGKGNGKMDGSEYGFSVGWDRKKSVWVARVQEFPHLSAESAEGPEQAVTSVREEVSLELLRWKVMKEEPPPPIADPLVERDRGKLPEHPRSFMWWDTVSFDSLPNSPDVVLFRPRELGSGKPGQKNLPSEQGRTPGDVYSVVTHFGLRVESSRFGWLRALSRETVAELFVFGRREAELSAAALVPGERAVSGFLALAAPLTLPPLTPLMVQVFSEPLVSLGGFDPETDYLEVRAFLYGRLRDVSTIRNK